MMPNGSASDSRSEDRRLRHASGRISYSRKASGETHEASNNMGASMAGGAELLRSMDRITCLFLLINTGLVLAWASRIDSPIMLGAAFLTGAVAAFFIPPMMRQSSRKLIALIGTLYPVAAFTFLYMSTASLNHASPVPGLDPWLAGIDEALFGSLVCDRFKAALPHRPFAEIMAFFYFSYYLMIPGTSLLLWFKRRRLCFEYIFSVTFSFYLYYLVFSIVPSAGPQFFAHEGAIVWDGYFFGPLLTQILEHGELPTGAFPSSHVGIALVTSVFAWRFGRGFGALIAFLTLGLSCAILYGAPHYALDLPCGLATGWIFLLLSRFMIRKRMLA